MSTTTRRAALRAASIAGLLGVPAVASALTAARQEAEDPVLEPYRRYRALNDEQDPICAQSDAIRAGLVERWGEVGANRPADDAWGHDPAHAELTRLNDEADSLGLDILHVTNQIIETPAATLPGVLVKLRVALDVWVKGADEDLDYHEVAAGAAMRDAVRILEGVAA